MEVEFVYVIYLYGDVFNECWCVGSFWEFYIVFCNLFRVFVNCFIVSVCGRRCFIVFLVRRDLEVILRCFFEVLEGFMSS